VEAAAVEDMVAVALAVSLIIFHQFPMLNQVQVEQSPQEHTR
jgi:hypothetical protein